MMALLKGGVELANQRPGHVVPAIACWSFPHRRRATGDYRALPVGFSTRR